MNNLENNQMEMIRELNHLSEQFQSDLNNSIIDLSLIMIKKLSEKGYLNDESKRALLNLIKLTAEGSIIFITTLFNKGFSIGGCGEIVIDSSVPLINKEENTRKETCNE